MRHRRAAGKEFSPLRSSFWNVHGEEIHRMETLRGWIFARERRDSRHFFRSSCTALSRFRPSSSPFASPCSREREKNPERKCFYSKGRKDRRVNPLTRETAFLFLLPFRIVSYGNSISTFRFQSWIRFYVVLKYQKKSISVVLLIDLIILLLHYNQRDLFSSSSK